VGASGETLAMLRLTELIGSPVSLPTGSGAAKLVDLTIRLGAVGGDPAASRLVERLLVRDGHGSTLLDWAAIDSTTVGSEVIRVRPEAAGETPGAQLHPPGRRDLDEAAIADLASDELLLVRDVLDTQIVDVVGHRVNRVGDVVLEPYDHHLQAIAVEVGSSAVLRRLGFGRRPPKETAIDWQDLHLTSDRGHTVQLATTSSAVHRLDALELAELLTRLHSDKAAEILRTVPPERAEAALRASHPRVRSRLHRIIRTDEPAPARWHRLRGWDRHRGPLPQPPERPT
jgi:sporulation protein YlmC with PRC-barrel domain